MIADLGSDRARRDLVYRQQCLERAKPYTVSLYQYQVRKLVQEHGLYPIRDGDDSVWALTEEFYDEEIGFSLNGTKIQFWEV